MQFLQWIRHPVVGWYLCSVKSFMLTESRIARLCLHCDSNIDKLRADH